jgi:N-acetyltransferase B complex (NatB) non catalytic subunit
LALHCQSSSSFVTSGGADAPNVATGGGRGFGIAPFAPESTASSEQERKAITSAAIAMNLAETAMTQAFDIMTPEQRDSEQLGLYIHTLVRQGKAKEALAGIAKGGKYYYEQPASSPSSGSSPSAGANGGASSSPLPTPVATGDATPAPASGGAGAAGDATAGAAERAEGEDVLESADGSNGRGKSPAPFQPVDVARYSAYLLLQLGARPATSSASEEKSHYLTSCLKAFSSLILDHDCEDWAYHTGLAVSVARGTIAAIKEASGSDVAGLIKSRLGAISTSDSDASAATGHNEVDGWLHHALPGRNNAFTAPTSAAPSYTEAAGARSIMTKSAASGKGGLSKASRAALLSLLQLLSVRLEIASRIIRGGLGEGSSNAAAESAAREAFAAASKQYGALIAHAFTSLAANASAFSDVKPYLLPFLTGTPKALADKFAADNLSSLDGFVAPATVHPVLLMPWHPAALVGSSADAAPSRPALRFSFTLDGESASIAKPLLDAAFSLRAKDIPTKECAARIEAIVSSAREAAIARDAAAAAEKAAAAKAAAEAGAGAPGGGSSKSKDKKKDKKKDAKKAGKGGKGGGIQLTFGDDDSDEDEEGGSSSGAVSKAADRAAGVTDESDPHGVKQALKPASELLFSSEQEAEIASIRSSIRRYTSAIGVLRFLGVLSLRGSKDHPFPVVSSPLLSSADGAANDETSLKTLADSLVTAWECTLPLSLTNVGGLRDVQEGDDLVLAALGVLMELAFHGLYNGKSPIPSEFASEFSSFDGSSDWASRPFSEDLTVGSVLRCRQYLLEASLLGDIACEISPYNGQLHLAVLRIYNLLGTAASATTRFIQLRARHISRDTLSHVTVPMLSRFAWPQALLSHSNEILAFHNQQRPHASEFVKVALREGNLSSAMDLIRMDRRLLESGTRAMARCNVALNHLISATSARTHLDAIALLGRFAKQDVPETVVDVTAQGIARLRDNDDREILPSCFDPPSIPLLQEWRMGLNLAGSSSSASAGAAALKEGFEVLAKHAAVANSYLEALFSSSTVAEPSACYYGLAAQFATGSNGGSFERLLRRINRDGSLICRQSAISLLSQASTFVEGVPGLSAPASASLHRWESVRALASSTSSVPALVPFLDFNNGTLLPLADTSFTTERSSVKAQLSDLLHKTLRMLFSGVCEGKAEATAENAAAATTILQGLPGKLLPFSHLPVAIVNPALTTAGASSAASTASATTTIVPPAADAASMIAASGVAPGNEKDKKAAAAAAEKAGTSPGIRPANPAMMAETSLFLLHTVPFLSFASAVLASKAHKGSPVAATASAFATELAKCVSVVEKDFKAGKDFLEMNVEKLLPLINGGFVEHACATTFVRKWLPRRKEKPVVPKAGTVVGFVQQANTERENKIRAKVEGSVLIVGAAYANTLATLHGLLEARSAFMRGLAGGK